MAAHKADEGTADCLNPFRKIPTGIWQKTAGERGVTVERIPIKIFLTSKRFQESQNL